MLSALILKTRLWIIHHDMDPMRYCGWPVPGFIGGQRGADGDSIEFVFSCYLSSEILQNLNTEKNVLPLTFRWFILRLRSNGWPIAYFLKCLIAAFVNRRNKREKKKNILNTVQLDWSSEHAHRLDLWWLIANKNYSSIINEFKNNNDTVDNFGRWAGIYSLLETAITTLVTGLWQTNNKVMWFSLQIKIIEKTEKMLNRTYEILSTTKEHICKSAIIFYELLITKIDIN